MGETMMALREAAEATGVGKSTIWRVIKAGRMSASRTDLGEFSIDPAELFRVFPAKRSGDVSSETAAGHGATGETPTETLAKPSIAEVELKARAELAEARLADLKEMVAELRTDRDKWRSQAERLLPAPATQSPPTPVEPARPWWKRIAR